MHRVELPRCGVAHDQHAALAHEGLAAVQIEEVPEAHAHHEDRVHDRVHVVGPDVGQAHREDVGLALDLDELLTMHVADRLVVHRIDLTSLHARHRVRRFDRVEDLTGEPTRCARQALARTEEQPTILGRPLPLAFHQELERRWKRVGVQRRLDLEDLHAGVGEYLAHRQLLVCSALLCRSISERECRSVFTLW